MSVRGAGSSVRGSVRGKTPGSTPGQTPLRDDLNINSDELTEEQMEIRLLRTQVASGPAPIHIDTPPCKMHTVYI